MSRFVGLDVHRRTCHATVMDEDGKISKQERFPSESEELDKFFREFDDGEVKVAMEATYAWQYIYDELEKRVGEVKLAHPRKTRIIAEAKIKTDARDSEALAHLLRANLIPEAWVPPKKVRMLQEKLRRRAYIVRKRSGFKNKVRAELAKRGIKKKLCFSKKDMKELREMEIGSINDYLTIIETFNEITGRIERELKDEAVEDEDVQLLITIPGVGFLSALTIVAEVGDIARFSDPEKLCSYAGLVPSTEQSGSKTKRGSITKQGNKYLRWILTECVWAHLRYGEDTNLIRFFGRIAGGKNRNIAAVATARKMLTVIYWMLTRKEKYRSQG